MAKYLDLVGLEYYDGKIKSWVNDRISDVNSSIADLESIRTELSSNTNAWTKFLDGISKTDPAPTLQTISDNLTALSNNKADKTDVYTKGEVDDAVAEAKQAGTDAATALEAYKTSNDAAVAEAKQAGTDVATALNDYKTSNDAAVAEAKQAGTDAAAALEAYKTSNDAAVAEAKQAGTDAATALNNYKTLNDAAVANKANVGDVYTKGEVDNFVNGINNTIKGGTKFIGVVNNQEELTAKNPDSGDIFVAAAEFGNFKQDIEYIYDGESGNWYELGNSSANAQAIADLTSGKADKANVYTKGEVDAAVAEAKQAGTDAATALNDYKTLNDAAVAEAKQAGTDAADALNDYKTSNNDAVSALGNRVTAIENLDIANTYATQTELSDGLASKATLVEYTDADKSRVKFTQGSIEVIPISNSDIEGLFPISE